MRGVYKLSVIVAVCTLIIAFSVICSISTKAATDSGHEPTCLYTDIKISTGDTLDNIADKYSDSDYISKSAYIDEIKRINGLNSDVIHAGCYLTIIYYE